jgi:hypothetical protein
MEVFLLLSEEAMRIQEDVPRGMVKDEGMYDCQNWALAHFFEVRYLLPTQFYPLALRSNARRSTSGSLSEKGLNHSSLIASSMKFSPPPPLFYNHLACQDSIPSLDPLTRMSPDTKHCNIPGSYKLGRLLL